MIRDYYDVENSFLLRKHHIDDALCLIDEGEVRDFADWICRVIIEKGAWTITKE